MRYIKIKADNRNCFHQIYEVFQVKNVIPVCAGTGTGHCTGHKAGETLNLKPPLYTKQ